MAAAAAREKNDEPPSMFQFINSALASRDGFELRKSKSGSCNGGGSGITTADDSRAAVQRDADTLAALRLKLKKLAEAEMRNASSVAMVGAIRKKVDEVQRELNVVESSMANRLNERKFKEMKRKKMF